MAKTCPKCGKCSASWTPLCRACARKAHEDSVAEARRIVDGGACPKCGRGLRRNSALAGWWQCEQFGAEQFRADATLPSCSFQTFTE